MLILFNLQNREAIKMACFSAKDLCTLVLASFISSSSFASAVPLLNPESNEERFKRTVVETNAIPVEYLNGEDRDRNLDIAWNHHREVRQLIGEHSDIYAEISPVDKIIPTLNGNGLHSGFTEALPVLLSMLPPQKNTHILEVGSCYGIDAVVLVRKYPHIRITTVDLALAHVDKMNLLRERCLNEEQRSRLTVLTADMRHLLDLGLGQELFDMVIFSKVLHYYDRPVILQSLANIYPLLKPGGQVVIHNISPKCHWIYELSHWFFSGGWVLYAGDPVTLRKLFYYNQADMQAIIGQTEFETIMNQYNGSTAVEWRAKWYTFGANYRQCYLLTILRKAG
jgi:ubiquinone/menaquinone biosynthesis C-methylase UbiE